MMEMEMCPKCLNTSRDGYICLHEDCDWVMFPVGEEE